MKVLLLTDWEYPCDHKFLTNVYAVNFAERGHDVTWVMRPNNSGQQTVQHKTWKGDDVYILPDSGYDPIRNYIRYKSGLITNNELFSTSIDIGDHDIVHVRNDLSMGLVATYVSKRHKIPFVHQISHLKAESLIEAHQQGYEGQTSWIKGQLGKRLRRHISNHADIVFPISKAMKTYLIQSGYKTSMEVIPTGTEIVKDIPEGRPLRSKYNIQSKHLLLYMGSMSPLRRLEFLFYIIDIVNDEYDTELLMVGGRSKGHRKRLRQLAADNNVASNVTFTGWVDNQNEIKQAIATADIGTSPLPTNSILRMNAPIKTLEYLSLGTPVVASATPDQQTVLNESGGGLAVDYRIKEFSSAIKKLLSSSDLRQAMGRRGRNYVCDNRNFEKLTLKVEQSYEQILTRR